MSCLASSHHISPPGDHAFLSGLPRTQVDHAVEPATPRLSDGQDWWDSWERAETLYTALQFGVDNVRGHMWTMVDLPEKDKRFFQMSVEDRKNRCKTCNTVYVVWLEDKYGEAKFCVKKRDSRGEDCDHVQNRDTSCWIEMHKVREMRLQSRVVPKRGTRPRAPGCNEHAARGKTRGRSAKGTRRAFIRENLDPPV